jgi:hydroxymethylpyrimidine pyrophosphatase-like HAD family hydrolase
VSSLNSINNPIGVETNVLNGRERRANAVPAEYEGPLPDRNIVDGDTKILLESELSFYDDYNWCLNPFLTIDQIVCRLRDELRKLRMPHVTWHLNEILTNVFLLGCALSNSVDDYIHGPTYKLPRPAAIIPLAKSILSLAEHLAALKRSYRVMQTRKWRQQWEAEFEVFLLFFVYRQVNELEAPKHTAEKLITLLDRQLPKDLQDSIIRIPSAFRKQDLTHFDLLALGRNFVDRFPDRRQPILVIGLRTAGSYFAPLLHALLKSKGYQAVRLVTLRPNQTLAAWERTSLRNGANRKDLAVLVDESPVSGRSVSLGVEHVRKAGFSPDRLTILTPLRAISRDWQTHIESITLQNVLVITLPPEEWYKQYLLTPEVIQERVREYFTHRQYKNVAIVSDSLADEFNTQLGNMSGDLDRSRLKRVYAVRVETQVGLIQTRYVLAKGVGWGLFGYAAFLAGYRLAGLVPPLLGLREGILYTEWLPQTAAILNTTPRRICIERIAEYVAARVRALSLATDPAPTLGLDSQHAGFNVLEKRLSKAYGAAPTRKLMSSRVRQQLSTTTCSFPTLIDGKMAPSEWISGHDGILKTDYEHHGFGKHELNVADPAYDLADAILQFNLSPIEEEELIRTYIEKSADHAVKDRLLMNKLMAGSWLMASALRLLRQPPFSDRAEFNEQYIRAWNFLTSTSMQFCGSLCNQPGTPTWRSPLVVLDVDGVLDRRHFGFPTTTAAGIRALGLLHSHGYAIAIDTARSAREVRDYCAAYGFVGGVAEYGSYVYDAVSNSELTVLSSEALEQIDILRQTLRQIPGVFLNDGYRYSLRAYTYGSDGTLPVPDLMVPILISSLRLNRLRSFQTTIDTTVLAKEVDKGKGLQALLALVRQPNLETIAIGDSEPDLSMFRVANRSYAPSQADHRTIAQSLGCQIAQHPFQRGLLTIIRSLIHPDGGTCHLCPPIRLTTSKHDRLFLDLLNASDETKLRGLFRGLFSPAVFRLFVDS